MLTRSICFDNRKDDDQGRFLNVVGSSEGKRITYKELKKKPEKDEEKKKPREKKKT